MTNSLIPMLIAPFTHGIDTDKEPWLAPPDSFQRAENVHIHHGYLEKRSGYRLFSTLSNGTRVMGIQRFINADGTKATLAFDLTRAYLYNPVTFAFDILDLANIFSGDEYDYIIGANWQSSNIANLLYFTNGKAFAGGLNGIRFFDNAIPTVTNQFTPSIDTSSGDLLYGGKLIFTLGQRLIVLYTFEYDGVLAATKSHPQRARWCAKQGPTNWIDSVAGGGDFADAGTGDQIISAQALQNQIIVFFTNSVWALVPTADPNKAFRWVRLNNYRACDGKMATIAYDRFVIGIGTRGITATDGSETKRIDQRILDFTNNDINIAEFKKVFCYRNYSTQRWWTLYAEGESEENNKALVYDDESKAFTKYDIALNCLGFGSSALDYKLSDFTAINGLDYSLDEMGEDTLLDWFFDSTEDLLLAGDISGNIFQLNFGAEDIESPINATFTTASWNPFQTEGAKAQMSYVDFYVDTDKKTKGVVEFYLNNQTTPYVSQEIKFLPNLDFIASVVDINKNAFCIVTAPNHGLQSTDIVYIYGSEGMVEISGQYTVGGVNRNTFQLLDIDSTLFGTYTGGASVYLKEFYQTKTWIRAYGGGIGYTHWIKVTLSGGEKPFRFHAISPFFRKRGRRLIN